MWRQQCKQNIRFNQFHCALLWSYLGWGFAYPFTYVVGELDKSVSDWLQPGRQRVDSRSWGFVELLHPLNAFKHTIKCRKNTFMPNVLQYYYMTVGKVNKIPDNDVNQLFPTCELQAQRGPWGYSKGSSNIIDSVACIPHILPFLKWLYLLLWWIHLELV